MGLKKLFKDYFEYYPSEKKGVFYLLSIIILWAVGLYFYSRMVVSSEPDTDFQNAVAEYYAAQSLTERAAVTISEETNRRDWNLFLFDPNTLPLDSLVMLGLPEYTARAIVNFRNSGGSFKTPESLSKIYTLSEQDFNEVVPYVRISSTYSEGHASSDSRENRYKFSGWEPSYGDSTQKQARAFSPPAIVELNLADSAELRTVIGIGGFFAREIAARRIALGGYRSFDQLLEIFRLDTMHLDRMSPYLTLDTNLVQKMDLNAVSLDQLRKHPYFSYSVANSIVKMREAHGPYSKVSDIKKSYLVNDSIFNRVKNYLQIDDKPK